MTVLCAGLALFFTAHFYSAFRTRQAGRDIKQRLGEGPYMGVYSLVSALGLGLIIWGYQKAGFSNSIYTGPDWAWDINAVLMLLAFVLLTATYLPLGYLKSRLQHPMLIGVALWAIAHLITGASLKQLLLFGSFLAFSVIDIIAVSMRQATASTRPAEVSWKFDLIAIISGSLAFAITGFWLHAWSSGISPFG